MADVVLAYQVALFTSLVATAGVLAYTVRRRDALGAVPLGVMVGGEFVWALCTLVTTVLPGTTVALFASKLSYVGVVMVVAGLSVFALEFTGNDQYLGPKTYALLSVEPVGVMIGVWLDPGNLFRTTVGRTAAEVSGWAVEHGPLFWAHTAYSYVLLGVSSLLLIQFALRSETLYRQQIYGILVGVFTPWIANAVYLTEQLPFDPTPIAFSFVGLGLYWAVFSADFLEISPVAHSAMVDSINCGVYVVDCQDRLVELNEKGRKILGVDDEDTVVGQSVRELLADVPVALERYRTLSDATEESTVELQVDDRYFDVQVTPLYNERDRLVGRVFLVYDITRQREREHELERRNRELNWFASVVSHDLRNPLNVASGTLDLARETGEEQHFETVEQSLDRMERLIEEVLMLAEGGDADTEVVRLDDVARQAWEHVATGDAALNVETDRRLLANRDQLLQLFENLYRNSIEHGTDSPGAAPARTDGAPPLTVTVGDLPDGFFVADDGPGIPAEERDEVFEHGYSTGSEGSGLGLTIVEHVTSAHGWAVAATESEEGGARFEITGIGDASTDE